MGFTLGSRFKKLEVQNTSCNEFYFRSQDWIQDQRLVFQIRRRNWFDRNRQRFAGKMVSHSCHFIFAYFGLGPQYN